MGVISTPEGIDFIRKCALRSALKLEVAGLKRGGQSAYSIVKKEFGFKGSKKKVLEQLINHIEDLRKEHKKHEN